MNKDLRQQAIELKQNRKHRKGWQAFVQMLALCVVFCTTYVLVLPAITLQEQPICGLEDHVHSQECRTQPRAALENCAIPDGTVVVHQHSELCRDEAGTLICTLAERSLHIHTESCHTLAEELHCPAAHVHSEACQKTEQVLTCTLPESEGHNHSESCTGTETVQVCVLAEHLHGDGCFEMQSQVCRTPESEEHTHSDSCAVSVTVLKCAVEEHSHGTGCFEERTVECQIPQSQGHTHSDECYTVTEIPCTESIPADHVHDSGCYVMADNLTCGQEEITQDDPMVMEHIHTESCLMVSESVLLCELQEHTHQNECYPVEEAPVLDDKYLCASAVHTHIESCLDESGALICTIPEHTHEAACLVAELDLNADVESEKDWMRSVSSMTRTGNWPADVVAVAETQLGYQESTRNLILSGEDLKGYTRYGAWYGDPYGDWCAMYASFCLSYAGVEDYPLESNVDRWIEVLTEHGSYAASSEYTGRPGDLIFFDHDQTPDGDVPVNPEHMGIVAELIPATEEEPAKIRTIEGNTQDQVAYRTYLLDDPTIIGYGRIPSGAIFRLIHEGPDYTVTVTVGSDAGIPDTAQLSVREIEMGTEEYNTYYEQALAALTAEEAPKISFARFFDICFLVDGVETEPAAPVDIQITYSDAIAVQAEEAGAVVHFAEEGVEVLQPDTSLTENEEAEGVDTFQFTQGSFSVTGTLVGTQAVGNTATRVDPSEIDNTGSTMYVLYAQIGGRYYALSGANGGTPVSITVSGNTVTLPTSNTGNLLWTFTDKPGDNTNYLYNPVYNVGTERHLHPYNGGAMTDSAWDVLLEVTNNGFKIRGNGNYRLRMTADSVSTTTSNNQATTFYIAAVAGSRSYNVWFDGTLGGMMSYYGAADTNIPVTAGDDGTAVVQLPETWQSSTKYPYKLRGWYDINTHAYYPVDPEDNIQPTATISAHTVFYADWIAATYDVGLDNEHVVDSIDTNDFITTHVFDYNVLFNVLSQYHTGTITAGSHSETWNIYNNGERVPYNGEKSLGFAFVDYDAGGDFSYANNRDNTNINQSGITSGILQEVSGNSGQDLLDLLFNPDTDVIGKYYAGTGNHLFQYMDSTSANYDGEHDGYYYLDARLNAASYNQTEQRFYHYDYLERTSDSDKDGGAGQYSDLLPFNSPYIFGEDDDYAGGNADAGRVDYYEDLIRRPGWEYDAKDGASSYQDYNTATDAATNYFFGIRTDIEFFLPNDTNTTDEYGNYGNISTRGEHMVFDFHGDDDVWVYIDGELVLDIGGLHGIMHGRIDFSTGTVSYGADGSENVRSYSLGEGTHHMTVYYMERGSSQSNCAIYFNIAPRYDLEITKEDIVTANKLDGAVFSIFDDEAMTDPSELWNSFEEHESGAEPTNTFTVVDGVAKCWGISAGKTYYIFETTPPPGYPASDDMIRITLNNRGTATIETTTLHGPNGVATEGFAVIKQEVNDTLKIVALTVTNQMEGDTTEVRVEKTWDENSVNLPPYITVYLTADGVRIGRSATLTEANGWSYTWTGLPKYRAEGIDEEIVYVVEEVFVPDYITVQGDSIKVENYVDWVRADQMSDSKTFLLVHNGQALTYDGSSFGWMERTAAEADGNPAAHWVVTTDHDGFHLKNELGYTLTYGSSGFYGVDDDAVELNQVFYYLNSRLMVHDHDVYYQFGPNGTVVQEDGLAFQLYQKEVLTGLLTNIINRPVDEEKQTFVEVSKLWSDGADKHSGDSVVVRLYADGKDTGRYVILNEENNWTASFDDLPYYLDGTETKIEYTVVEEELSNYLPEYSEGQVLEGRPVSFWKNVEALEAGTDAYRIYASGYALTVDSENDATTAPNDLDDESQQWTVVNRNGSLILQNVGTGRYLMVNGSDLTTTTSRNQAAVVAYTDGYITVGGKYLELGTRYAGVTDSAANVDREALRVTRWSTSTGMEGVGYTITNHYGRYHLPESGGQGITSLYTFGSLLILAAVMMYITKFGPKRRKGGV